MPSPLVIQRAEATSLSFFTVLTNQLAPSAARSFVPEILPVITGASATDIHSEKFHNESFSASVRFPADVVRAVEHRAVKTANAIERLRFIIIFKVLVHTKTVFYLSVFIWLLYCFILRFFRFCRPAGVYKDGGRRFVGQPPCPAF